MKNITNNELHQLMNDNKMQNYQHEKSGQSDCCGASVYADIMICSECKDHCEYYLELCGFCGEEEHELINGFCSDNCWNGYKAETFNKD